MFLSPPPILKEKSDSLIPNKEEDCESTSESELMRSIDDLLDLGKK